MYKFLDKLINFFKGPGADEGPECLLDNPLGDRPYERLEYGPGIQGSRSAFDEKFDKRREEIMASSVGEHTSGVDAWTALPGNLCNHDDALEPMDNTSGHMTVDTSEQTFPDFVHDPNYTGMSQNIFNLDRHVPGLYDD